MFLKNNHHQTYAAPRFYVGQFITVIMKTIVSFAFIITVFLFTACSGSDKRYIPEVRKSELPGVNIKIKRYGKAIFSIDTNNLKTGLKAIQNNYLLFLGADLDDSINLNKIKGFVTDTLNQALYEKTMMVFPDLHKLNEQLSAAYSYLKYYFPEYPVQSFYSYISGVYYENPVMVYDTFALIGLDNYLGKDCRYYDRFMIPKYKSRWMIPEEVAPDVMREVYFTLPQKNYKPSNLLDLMIAAGKRLYFLDAVMPDVPDTIKIKYTTKQLQWVEQNEKNVWAFLISEKLLFTADFKQSNKLMQDGPFTNGFSREAPSRLGEWIGWQIVSSFMKNNQNISLKRLLQINDAQEILNRSGYKP